MLMEAQILGILADLLETNWQFHYPYHPRSLDLDIGSSSLVKSWLISQGHLDLDSILVYVVYIQLKGFVWNAEFRSYSDR